MEDLRLINIDLRWSRGIVTRALGRFHWSRSPDMVVEIDGLSLPADERLNWNILRDKLYAAARDKRKGK